MNRIERLEQRSLLAAAVNSLYPNTDRYPAENYLAADYNHSGYQAEGEGNPLLRFSYEFVSVAGQSLDPNPADPVIEYRAAIGDVVKLRVYAEDLRQTPQGILSAYHDIAFTHQDLGTDEILGLLYGEANIVRVELPAGAGSYSGSYQLRYEALDGTDTTSGLGHPLADGVLNQADADTLAAAIGQLNWSAWVSPDVPVTARLLPNESIAGKDYASFSIEFTGSNLRRKDQPDVSLVSNSLQYGAGNPLAANVEVIQPDPLDARSVSVATAFPVNSGNQWGEKRQATWHQVANGYELRQSGGTLQGTTVASPAARKLLYEVSFEVLKGGTLELEGALSDVLIAPIYLIGNPTPLNQDQIVFPQAIRFQAVEPGSDYLERNNTQATASDLGVVEGSFRLPGLSIHSSTDQDWLRFTTLATANHSHFAAISFNHLAGDLDFELYNQAGQRLAVSETSNNQEYVSLQGLAAGTYFVRVIGYQGASNLDYELQVQLPVANIGGDGLEANDTISSATNLGVVTAAGQLAGLSIHSATDTDYFRFEIASQGRASHYVQIDFVHASGDLELRLYNAAGVLLETAATSNDFERISLAGRNAGVYFIQVRGENNAVNPRYDLIIQPPTSTIEADIFEPNDQRTTATNIPVTQPFYEFERLSIHQSGNEDWYSFYLSKAGTAGHYVSIDFEHSLGDIDLQLLDRNGLLVRSSSSAANEERISLAGLPIGNYFIRVAGNNNARQQNYKLALSVPVVEVEPDFFEPANTRQTAYDLRTLEGAFSLDYLTIHQAADEDWFRFKTTAESGEGDFVGLLYRAGDGDVDLELFDANGNSLAVSSVNDNWEQIGLEGREAGTYFVRVRSATGQLNAQYSLGFSVPRSELQQDRFEANEARAAASDLKAIAGVYALTGLSIHVPGDQDWYRFSLVGDGRDSHFVELQSSATSGDIDVELFDRAGNLLQRSSGAADSERLSLDGYSAGEYYLRILGRHNATAESYALRFDTPLISIAADPYESNDFRNTAYDLRGLEGGREVLGGSIHSSADQDWFRFQLLNLGREAHYVALNFSHVVGDLDLALFDASGNLLRSSNTTQDRELISLNGLVGGTYFVRVSGFAGATQPLYDLEFQTPIGSALVPDRFETNNNFSNATVVRNEQNVLQGSFVLNELNIHTATDHDYFRFSLVSPATLAHSITLDFNPSDGDLDLWVYDANGMLLRESTHVSSIDHISLAGLMAGTYTVAVKGKANATNSYRLVFDTPLPAGKKDEWTIMVYMSSSHQESEAFADINELEEAALGLPGTVNLVVYWDQSSVANRTRYATGNGAQAAWGTVGQAVLRPDRNPNSIASSFELFAEQNSGAAESLSQFIRYATAVAPAKRYALITWGQGGGLSGFVNDDADGSPADQLEIEEWLQALRADTTPHLDVLALDASVSATAELAYSARQLGDYLIAASSAIPSTGFHFGTLFEALKANANVSGSLLAASMLQSHARESALTTEPWQDLIAVELDKMQAVGIALKGWVTATAGLSVAQRDAMLEQLFSGVGYWNAEYRDVGQGMQQLVTMATLPDTVRTASQNVIAALDSAVWGATRYSHGGAGLSIVLPYQTSMVDEYKTRFEEFFAATDWDDFVTGVVDRYEELGTANQRLGRAVTQKDWSEPNGLAATATNLYQQSGTNHQYTELSLPRGDDVDWFRFSIGAGATAAHQIRLTKEGSAAVKIELYDATGATLLRTHTATTVPTLSLNGLAAGSYLLKVSAADGVGVSRYALVFDAPAITTPVDRTGSNQTVGRAFELGVVLQSTEHLNQTLASLGEEWFALQSPKLPESTWYSIQLRLSAGIAADAILRNSAGEIVSKASGSNELILGYKAPPSGERYHLQLQSKTAVGGRFHLRIENLQATFADVVASENLAGLVIDGLPLNELVAAAGTVSLSDTRFQWQNHQLRLGNEAYLSLAAERVAMVRLTVQDTASAGRTVSVMVPIDIQANANPWHNTKLPYNTNFDVDSLGNEVVNAIDALTIINALNRAGGSYRLPIFRRATPGAAELQFDVNNDGSVTAIDALVVINYLNRRR